ncbi:DMT family transporter [Celeribacter neptunius]|uniref:Permease of the drug/metabolite transporter (DMT) superfamily n=1 Tax=Celeribacter neptunius TaxID=588602 RepID=A0A1I3UD87_9RHOB|nr:DMT family transporter [Celeribacter neptunius]SFJ80980.1 Permease of the drug/metabolite transporter (DMT) superfamily [Celeribacter neptunius]
MSTSDFSETTLSASRRPERLAFAASALAAMFWGSNFEATRIVLESLPSWTAAASRFAIAAIAILLWLHLAEGVKLEVLRRNGPAFVALGLIGVAGFNAALFLGMRSSSPVTAALIMATSPLTTNLIDAAISRRRPTALSLIGMAISLCGVALTVGAFSGAHFGPGDILIFAGSLAWALYTVGCRRWVREASPLETSAWTMVFGAITLGISAFLFETPVAHLAQATPAAWGATLWMALAGSALAFVFWQIGIKHRGPAATSILFNLVPVAALLIATAFGRSPHLSQILGVVLAIFGVLLASGRLFPKRA